MFDIINPVLVVVGRMLALLAALCFIFDLTAALLLGYFAFWHTSLVLRNATTLEPREVRNSN